MVRVCHLLRALSLIWAFGLCVFAACGAALADTIALAELGKPGRALMLRHALAPGTGDPPGFRLDDCATQRNLDDRGRQQATRLGARLAGAGIKSASIYASQWCRCQETARLLQLGTVNALPALNSFYERPTERDANIAALRAFLAKLPVDGPPVILVTHQFTINAVTDAGTPSGGGSLFQLNGSGQPVWLGRVAND